MKNATITKVKSSIDHTYYLVINGVEIMRGDYYACLNAAKLRKGDGMLVTVIDGHTSDSFTLMP